MNCLNTIGAGIVSRNVTLRPISSFGFNSYINTIYALDATHVYIGGDFTLPYKYITMWDGATMQKMGSGVSATVNSISAVDDSHVYIGGNFKNTANNENYFAIWNNTTISQWFSPSPVLKMSAVDASHIYFIPSNYKAVIKYNGIQTNTSLGTLLEVTRSMFVINNTNIYIGDTKLRRWNGSTITSLVNVGTTIGTIYVLDESHVYFGTSNGFKMWDGSKITDLGSLNGAVSTIYALDATHIYIGGYFTLPYKYITMWDGTSMQQMGLDPFNGGVRSIYALDEFHVYIGGQFTLPKKYITMWDGTKMT